MRKYLYVSVLILCLCSCRKTTNEAPLVDGSLLLTEVKFSNSATNTVFFRTATYDRNGRLINISSTDKNGVQRGGHEISYPTPRTVRLKEWIEQSDVYGNEIEIVLDSAGRPVARYQRRVFNRNNPYTWSNKFDSTFYQYGADGLLELSYARNSDTVNAPGVEYGGIFRRFYTDTTYFTNAGGNLVSTLSVGKDSIIRYDNGIISREKVGRRVTTVFDYSMQVMRGNYGKNSFLYQELNLVGVKPHPFHLPYQLLANKTTVTSEEKDSANGQWKVVSTDVKQYEPNSFFTYNPLSLLTRVAYAEATSGIRYFTDFTYQ